MQVLHGASVLEEYLSSMEREINASPKYRKSILFILRKLNRFVHCEDFDEISQQDIFKD
jgi:hypothetical protein